MVRGRAGKEGEQGEVDNKDLGLPFVVSLARGVVPTLAEGVTKLPECLEKKIKSSSHWSVICPQKPGAHQKPPPRGCPPKVPTPEAV